MNYWLKITLLFILLIGVLGACADAVPPSAAPAAAPNLHPTVEIAPTATEVTEISKVQAVWQTPLTAAVNTTPIVDGDLVVIATSDGHIHAIDAITGSPVWRFESEARVWDASLRAADGLVCVGRQGGLLTCLKAESGETLWTAELGLEMQSRPALVDGRLYAPTTHVGSGLDNNYEGQASLFALDAATGNIIWEAVTDNYILRRPITVGDLVVTGGTHLAENDGEHPPTRIYAFDSAAGQERWRYDSEDGLIRWLAATDEIVAFSGGSEIVHALSLATGELLWSFGPSYWMQFPAIVDGKLFMGSGDERFHALNAADGAHLWETRIDLDSLNQIGRPLLQDNLAVFNAVTGDIYALRQEDGGQVFHLETGISSRVGGALYENLYIMGDPEGILHAFSLGE